LQFFTCNGDVTLSVSSLSTSEESDWRNTTGLGKVPCRLNGLRGCSLATSILQSQNFRFQITIYLEGNWDFLAFNIFSWALNYGANSYFSQKIFWMQIRMNLLFEYNRHETAIFTKHKHIILTWENSLKYSAWQLSFAFSCKWCYTEYWETMKNVMVPYININRYIGCNTTIRKTDVFD
jgi:hypothetical protein